ncbi:hypothetical protein [Actinoallomurus vinaceus]
MRRLGALRWRRLVSLAGFLLIAVCVALIGFLEQGDRRRRRLLGTTA